MKSDLSTLCDEHTRDICPDTLIYLGKVWGLYVKDGSGSFIQIFYCPW